QAQPSQPAQAGQSANGATGTASQAGAPAATTAKNEISGCMTRGFANYQLSDSATQAKYQIRGNGADFAQHENKVVQIQGVPDPKDSQGGQPIFYANTVKDTGQTCGNPQQQQMASNAAAPAQAGAATGSSQTASSTTQAVASNSQQAASSATPAATPNVQAGASPAAASAGQSPAENGANGSAAQS